MTHDTFKKAERIQRQIRELKELIGCSVGFSTQKYIQAAEDDEQIKALIEDKIKRLQNEFEAL